MFWLPDPDVDTLQPASVASWYGNIANELRGSHLSASDIDYLVEYYREAGLLRRWRSRYFRRHFIESFHQAANYLLGSKADGTVVDLGCGAGTQSLLLALAGARVVGLDMDTAALDVFATRIRFYEGLCGRKLDIQLFDTNVFDFDFGAVGGIRGIYSMFAFNMMQPSARLLDRMVPHMTPGGRIAIIDGNTGSWLSRTFPGRRRQAWSPQVFAEALSSHSFSLTSLRGGVALPPVLWSLLPYSLLAPIDRLACGNLLLPVSHQIMAEKRAGETQAKELKHVS